MNDGNNIPNQELNQTQQVYPALEQTAPVQNENPFVQTVPVQASQPVQNENPFVQTPKPIEQPATVQQPVQQMPVEPQVQIPQEPENQTQTKKSKSNNDMLLTSTLAKVIGTIICLIIFVIILVIIAKKFFVLQ